MPLPLVRALHQTPVARCVQSQDLPLLIACSLFAGLSHAAGLVQARATGADGKAADKDNQVLALHTSENCWLVIQCMAQHLRPDMLPSTQTLQAQGVQSIR